MIGMAWQTHSSGLRTREDDFSWQGALESDPQFFLRRSKDEPEKTTDVLFGQLTDEDIVPLFAEFLDVSGGIPSSRIVFASIGRIDESHDDTVATFDRVVKIGTDAAALVGRFVMNRFLERDAGRWNAILDFRQTPLGLSDDLAEEAAVTLGDSDE